jgi:hypothetical protein
MCTTCPKCQHVRQAANYKAEDICPSCGLVFNKWLKSLASGTKCEDSVRIDQQQQTLKLGLFQFFCPARPNIAKGDFFLYLAIWVIFFAWGIDFIIMDFQTDEIGLSWFHNIDLVFHAAGHLLFIPFGRTMTIFGGSLLQVLMPFFCLRISDSKSRRVRRLNWAMVSRAKHGGACSLHCRCSSACAASVRRC